jgi:hypothetical protein
MTKILCFTNGENAVNQDLAPFLGKTWPLFLVASFLGLFLAAPPGDGEEYLIRKGTSAAFYLPNGKGVQINAG